MCLALPSLKGIGDRISNIVIICTALFLWLIISVGLVIVWRCRCEYELYNGYFVLVEVDDDGVSFNEAPSSVSSVNSFYESILDISYFVDSSALSSIQNGWFIFSHELWDVTNGHCWWEGVLFATLINCIVITLISLICAIFMVINAILWAIKYKLTKYYKESSSTSSGLDHTQGQLIAEFDINSSTDSDEI